MACVRSGTILRINRLAAPRLIMFMATTSGPGLFVRIDILDLCLQIELISGFRYLVTPVDRDLQGFCRVSLLRRIIQSQSSCSEGEARMNMKAPARTSTIISADEWPLQATSSLFSLSSRPSRACRLRWACPRQRARPGSTRPPTAATRARNPCDQRVVHLGYCSVVDKHLLRNLQCRLDGGRCA